MVNVAANYASDLTDMQFSEKKNERMAYRQKYVLSYQKDDKQIYVWSTCNYSKIGSWAGEIFDLIMHFLQLTFTQTLQQTAVSCMVMDRSGVKGKPMLLLR